VRNEGDTAVLVCWFCFGREHEEQCLGFFLILMKNDFAWLGWLIFVFDLVNYLVALEFVWFSFNHTSFLPMSCLYHPHDVILPSLSSFYWLDDIIPTNPFD